MSEQDPPTLAETAHQRRLDELPKHARTEQMQRLVDAYIDRRTDAYMAVFLHLWEKAVERAINAQPETPVANILAMLHGVGAADNEATLDALLFAIHSTAIKVTANMQPPGEGAEE